jgi:hypothetical protein
MKGWSLWTPAFAVHPETRLPVVAGRYEERDELDDVPRQHVEAECLHPGCGAQLRTVCDSGQPRRHIQAFAKVHMSDHFRRYPTRPG